MTHDKTRIIIEIKGGMVSQVYTLYPARVDVIDHDCPDTTTAEAIARIKLQDETNLLHPQL